MILVTGGTGFLGSHLLRKLVNVGEPVRALYRSKIPYQLEDIQDKIEWVIGDILDVNALEDAMVDIDKVYHCAAVVSFHSGNHAQMMKVNVEGTANVVNLAIDAGVKKLVHVSSVAAIGRAKGNGVVDEECEWQESKNNSQYAVSKYLAEMEVWRATAEGLETVIVNPSIILGSGFWDEGSGMLVKNAWKEFPFYTDGVTGFVDVKDVAEVMIRLMESSVKGQRFILSAENYGYQQLFTEMATLLGKKPPHIAVKPWLAAIVWRIESLKTKFTGKKALLTKETARTAQLKVHYNNKKILSVLPGFAFTPLKTTLGRLCTAYKEYKILSEQ
jgi:nucleoside-diphosphate-sugar epimerase